MCSSGTSLCGRNADEGGGNSNRRGNRAGASSSGSGSQYALCALGVGLVALGIVMVIWTVVPLDASSQNSSTTTIKPGGGGEEEEDDEEDDSKTKTSSVAYLLVGSGVAVLLLAICLGVRNKKRAQRRATMNNNTARNYMDHVPGEEESAGEPAPDYGVPTYMEAVGSGQYPVRQSNLRNSTTHLPSYEDLIAAVENEADGPTTAPTGTDTTSSSAVNATPEQEPNPPAAPPAASGHAPAAATTSNPPQRSSSRASRILRPLRVRRIKSDKLHLKDIRLNMPTPAPGSVTIEPLTPPPQYEDKPPEF